MHRLASLALLCVLLLPAAPVVALDLTELAARTRPSVVHLSILGPTGKEMGSGSGFFVAEHGLIVTNYHVIEQARRVRVKLSDGSERAVLGVLGANEQRDVAIVQAEGRGFPALELGASSELEQGDKVVVIGSPTGLAGTLSEGIVSALRESGIPGDRSAGSVKLGRLIQITAPISPGSSGSPVLNAEGKVVAVATLVKQGGGAQNLNFAVPVEAVDQLLATIRFDAVAKPFYTFPWRNLAISAVFFSLVGLGIVAARRFGAQR